MPSDPNPSPEPSTTLPVLARSSRDVTPLAPDRRHSRTRSLRGRWRWITVALLIGLLLGGVAGYFSTLPIYRASGRIELSLVPTSPVGPGADEALSDRLFDAAVDRHVALLQSPDLIGGVMASDAWQQLAFHRIAGVDGFEHRMTVAPGGDASSQIDLAFTDTDPRVAALAIDRVLHAYSESPAVKAQATIGRLIDQLVDERAAVEPEARPRPSSRSERHAKRSVRCRWPNPRRRSSLSSSRSRSVSAENRIALATIEREAIDARPCGVPGNSRNDATIR